MSGLAQPKVDNQHSSLKGSAMKKPDLLDYFTKGLETDRRCFVGAEIETHFVDGASQPITLAASQAIFKRLISQGWSLSKTKGQLIAEITKDGNKLLYELGRQNIELATLPVTHTCAYSPPLRTIQELYRVTRRYGIYPLPQPIIETDEDLLIIPDERDASWLKLDGRESLALLARTASVQFTIEANDPNHAIRLINSLAEFRPHILESNPYPQEELWRKYIATSKAGYRSDRYGVVRPESIEDYVDKLAKHEVVVNGKLVPFEKADQDIDLFLRSVWWNFRLRRYNNRLCIEIRTLARRRDEAVWQNWEMLDSFISSL